MQTRSVLSPLAERRLDQSEQTLAAMTEAAKTSYAGYELRRAVKAHAELAQVIVAGLTPEAQRALPLETRLRLLAAVNDERQDSGERKATVKTAQRLLETAALPADWLALRAARIDGFALALAGDAQARHDAAAWSRLDGLERAASAGRALALFAGIEGTAPVAVTAFAEAKKDDRIARARADADNVHPDAGFASHAEMVLAAMNSLFDHRMERLEDAPPPAGDLAARLLRESVLAYPWGVSRNETDRRPHEALKRAEADRLRQAIRPHPLAALVKAARARLGGVLTPAKP